MPKLKFDICNENFDHYFANCLEDLTEEKKDKIPADISYKIFHKGGLLNFDNSRKLSFLAKLFILWRALKKRWYIIVEDDDHGINGEQFAELRKRRKEREPSLAEAEIMQGDGWFILGDKQLCDGMAFKNNIAISPAYNYLIRTKNADIVQYQNESEKNIEDWKKQMDYVMRLLSCYESQKKIWVMTTNLTMPEWLVLIYIYHGREVVSSQIYKEVYKYAYNSSATQIKLAFGTLKAKGFVEKIGFKKGVTIKITSLGIDMVNTIMKKYVLNC